MEEKPKRRDEAIVSRYMWSSILIGAGWTFALSMVFILTPFAQHFFRPDPSALFATANEYLLTGYFAFFIFIAVFNAFNARTEQRNLFDNIGGNPGFLRVMGSIAAVQVLMTYFGGVIFRCFGLTVKEWVFVLVMAFTIIPVDLIRKSIVRKDS